MRGNHNPITISEYAELIFVQLYDDSTGYPDEWHWDVGSHLNVSTAENPIIDFNSLLSELITPDIGLPYFPMTLTAKKGGIETSVKSWNIQIDLQPLVPNFTYSLEEESSKTVDFTNTSTGNITSVKWYFGDGSTSTDTSPSHPYSEYGKTYSVRLELNGKKDIVKNITTGNSPATADFNWRSDHRVLYFTDESSGPVTSWFWDFGDGNTSTLQSPTHIYDDNTLQYEVTLIVNGDTSGMTRRIYITVANFDWTVEDKVVSFTGDVRGQIPMFAWFFGDGNFEMTTLNPVHEYALYSQEYSVALSAYDINGFDQAIHTVTTDAKTIFADFGWRTHQMKIIIDHTKVAGNLTNTTIVFTEANFTSTFKDLSRGLTPKLDGGDVRFYSDILQTQEIPISIVLFSLNNDPGLSQIEIHANVPSISSTVDTNIYVAWGNPADNKRATTDTYGQYNAYKSGYKLWSPMMNTGGATVGDLTSNQLVGKKMFSGHPSAIINPNPFIHSSQYFDAANAFSTDFSTTDQFTYNNSLHTITRHTGSFLADGFQANMRVNISRKSGSTLLDTDAMNGLRTIQTINDTVITVAPTDTLPTGNYESAILAVDHITFPAFATGTQFTVFSPFNVTGVVQSWNGLIYNKYWWSTHDGFEYNLIPGQPKQLEILSSGSDSKHVTVFNDVTYDGWETLTVKFDGTTAKTFVGGMLKATATFAESVAPTTYPYFMIGTSPNHIAPLTGWIGAFIVYVGVISDNEIMTLQNNRKNPGSFASAVDMGKIVFFKDLTIGGAISWAWDFGDGNISTDEDPIHEYPDYDTEYTVSLTVNTDKDTKIETVTTGAIDAAPVANFTWQIYGEELQLLQDKTDITGATLYQNMTDLSATLYQEVTDVG